MDDYSRFAFLYDTLVGPFLRPIHEAMLKIMTAQGSRTVLDLCCGTGMLAGMAADRGARVVGVDLSPAMLHEGRTKHPAVTFLDGDATSLIFSDNEFDAVLLSFALHEKSRQSGYEILAEAWRVMKPDGVLLIADYRKPPSGQSPWTGVGISLIERMAGREHYAHFKEYMENNGAESYLERIGLLPQPVRTFLHGWAGLYFCDEK
ncbi:class I SAM-dependent methyltransferase [uncultured Pseudodesulfovibrio sp.]|uniref:class I SAM-dependent methyltransferase n=1 Tax=uncultured Pseudodesulfovibrio sp. TaxID=2035858 RepID=UPI0029C844DD|nr:class I SAM-dependent methyltransferase [uncultured Pseudodesulfovibrio sp.]